MFRTLAMTVFLVLSLSDCVPHAKIVIHRVAIFSWWQGREFNSRPIELKSQDRGWTREGRQ